jgi:hypothetical protein
MELGRCGINTGSGREVTRWKRCVLEHRDHGGGGACLWMGLEN